MPVAHVRGTLTVYLATENGIVEVRKDGYGSKAIIGKQSEQDSIFKAAGTDALKKAASLFGIGLQLYRNEEEQYYVGTINYEDPWTDEAKEEHADSLAYIEDYKTQYGVTDEQFMQVVYSVTGTDQMLTPENIEIVVAGIQQAIGAQAAQ